VELAATVTSVRSHFINHYSRQAFFEKAYSPTEVHIRTFCTN